MGLNLSNGNMYKFVNYTWNPIKGKCLHDCSYCYMKTMPQYQHLILAENEFKTDLGNGNRIFIGSTTDAFAENVPSEWIVRILDYCYQNHNAEKPNAYLLQSKNPKRFLEFINHPIMERVIFGTTIETNRFYPEIMNKAPRIEERVEAMEEIARLGRPTMVTAEPLMQFDHEEVVSFIRRCSPKLVNIGKESKGRVKLPRAYPRRSPATHCGTEIVCQCERERQRFDMAQVTAEKESWRKPAIWRNPTFVFY